jgi:hypothetical protein
VLRGGVLAVTSAALAVLAHTAAGGTLPDTGLTVLLTVGVAAVGVTLASRRRSTAAVLAVLAAAQLASHVLLSVDAMGGMPSHGDGLPMLGAHALAVLVSAVVLARADDAVFLVAAVLAMLLPVLAVPPPPEAPVRIRRRLRPADRQVTVLLRRSHARRGPPATG